MPFVWILGPSAVGKTTLTARLQQELDCETICVGKIIRNIYPEERIVKRDVPENEIYNLVRSRIRNSYSLNIIDGYPISQEQLDLWESQLCKPSLIIVLEVSEEKQKARKLQRGRSDDSEKDFYSRKVKYETGTLPIIARYEGVVHRINGELSEEEVYYQATKLIQRLDVN